MIRLYNFLRKLDADGEILYISAVVPSVERIPHFWVIAKQDDTSIGRAMCILRFVGLARGTPIVTSRPFPNVGVHYNEKLDWAGICCVMPTKRHSPTDC